MSTLLFTIHIDLRKKKRLVQILEEEPEAVTILGYFGIGPELTSH